MVFEGFTDRTFEFFMAIRFNNNRTFFEENRAWYERDVRTPCRALAADLGPVIEALDGALERRPERVVSRINRDVRFTLDKSPYRDYVWLAFRRPGEDRKTTLAVYFDLSDGGGSYGMGIYDENRPLMNGLRQWILADPEAVRAAFASVEPDFQLHPTVFKRLKIPERVPESLRTLYALRGFYVERDLDDLALLRSCALVKEIERGIRLFTPLYRAIHAIAPLEKMPESE